ncbi:MAG: Cna B-type domain-containing protein, partial [Erysipelotrichaceae bacterium]|nr:Cna B-type domain-containing protein [Erysipelotrichaceae bacterium]
PADNEPIFQEEVAEIPAEETAQIPNDDQPGYFVEISYQDQKTKIDGNTQVSLSDALHQLGLHGDVSNVQISNSSLVSAEQTDGGWILTSLQPFHTEEWMTLTINDQSIRIQLLDDAVANNEAQLIQAIAQASGQSSITINGTISLTNPLTISSGKQITLRDGILKLADTWSHVNTPVITIESGASLTIDGTVLDGNGSNVVLQGLASHNANGSFIRVAGDLILKSGAIQNVSSGIAGFYGGIVFVEKDGTLTMDGGEIKNNQFIPYNGGESTYCGIVMLDDGAKMEINGGSINHNSFHRNNYDYVLNAVVYLYNGATVNMTDGAIEDNPYRAVRMGGMSNPVGVETNFTMTGGTIRNNTFNDLSQFIDEWGVTEDYLRRLVEEYGWAGEGVFDHIGGGVEVAAGTFTLDGGTIYGNSALLGGGVAVYTQWGNDASFQMKSGTIENNNAWIGGGVYVSGHPESTETTDVLISGGTIKNNQALAQGGGLYACKDFTIKLENVIIHDNEASIMGGGIWGCPTSNVYAFVTNGGAIYDNYAWNANHEQTPAQAGDDIASVPQTSGHTLYLAQRALGGGQILYYYDGTILGGPEQAGFNGLGRISPDSHRYDPSNPGEPISGLHTDSTGYALHTNFSGVEKQLAIDMHKVEITGNRSQRGGGIGTNGNIVIGSVPDSSDPTSGEFDFIVKKEWSSEFSEAEKSIHAQLIRLFNGREYKLDIIELTAENPSYTFTGLPVGDYSVQELDVSESVKVTYSKEKVSLSTEKTEDEITILNEKKPEPEPEPEPDPKPEPKPEPTPEPENDESDCKDCYACVGCNACPDCNVQTATEKQVQSLFALLWIGIGGAVLLKRMKEHS